MPSDLGSQRKSILFVSWNFPPRRGGIEEMVQQLFCHLAASGSVTMLTGRNREAHEDPAGVRRSPLPGLAGFLIWLAWRAPVDLLFRRNQMVLSSGALVGSIVELVAKLLRRPHAVLIYGTDITYPATLYQCWLRRVLPSVPRLIAISGAVAEELVARRLAAASAIKRLPPGIDRKMVDKPVDENLVAAPVPVLLFVGRIIPRKGLAPFVEECLPRILERRPVELWVVGGEATESLAHRPGALARLRTAIAGSELEPRVRFLGSVPDRTLRSAYRAAKLLVLPAIAVPGDVEGFGIVFLEAALFGVPAVSTRIGGIPDAVADGETGLLVEPGDWVAFGDAVLRLLEDERQYRAMSEKARRRAAEEFDWNILSRRCYRIIEETCR